MGIGQWIPAHKKWFLAAALGLMALSLYAAFREKIRSGKNLGLVVTAVALLVTVSLLFYKWVRYGYFM